MAGPFNGLRFLLFDFRVLGIVERLVFRHLSQKIPGIFDALPLVVVLALHGVDASAPLSRLLLQVDLRGLADLLHGLVGLFPLRFHPIVGAVQMLLVCADLLSDPVRRGLGVLDGLDHAPELVGAAQEGGQVPHLEARDGVLYGPGHALHGIGNAAGHVPAVGSAHLLQRLRRLPPGSGLVWVKLAEYVYMFNELCHHVLEEVGRGSIHNAVELQRLQGLILHHTERLSGSGHLF